MRDGGFREMGGEGESHLRSYQWYGVREVFLEKLDDFISCGDLLKIFKGHEKGTGECLVLNQKVNRVHRDVSSQIHRDTLDHRMLHMINLLPPVVPAEIHEH